MLWLHFRVVFWTVNQLNHQYIIYFIVSTIYIFLNSKLQLKDLVEMKTITHIIMLYLCLCC